MFTTVYERETEGRQQAIYKASRESGYTCTSRLEILYKWKKYVWFGALTAKTLKCVLQTKSLTGWKKLTTCLIIFSSSRTIFNV